MKRRGGEPPAPEPTRQRPLNSLDWLARFVVQLMALRPGVDQRAAMRLAMDAWPELGGAPPEHAAAIVARWDPRA